MTDDPILTHEDALWAAKAAHERGDFATRNLLSQMAFALPFTAPEPRDGDPKTFQEYLDAAASAERAGDLAERKRLWALATGLARRDAKNVADSMVVNIRRGLGVDAPDTAPPITGTAREHLKAAWEALRRGDTAERDRLVKLASDCIAREVRLGMLKPGDPTTSQ